MKKAIRRTLIGTGAAIVLLVALVIGAGLLFDVNHYKPRIEAAVAASTGMQLKVDGKASIKLFPRVRVSLRNVRLSNRGSELFDAEEVEAAPRILPFLLHRSVFVDHVTLIRPKVQIVKSESGQMNYEPERRTSRGTSKGGSGPGPGQIRWVSIRDGELTYVDRKSGQQAKADGLNVDLSDIAWPKSGTGPQAGEAFAKSVSFQGHIEIRSVQSAGLAASDVKAGVRDERGLIDLNPTEASAFGGIIRGTAQIDLRGATPRLKIAQTAPHVDLAQVPSNAGGRVSGVVSASVDLSASGKNTKALTKTAAGNIAVHGRDITLSGVDIDSLAGKLKTAQGLDLVHIGSSIASGPLAPMLGQAAGIAGGASEEKSVVRNLVSDWTIAHGVAQAKDVAFSTAKTTIAIRGSVNLIDKRFLDFHIATIDANGCSKSKIKVVGSLSKPRPDIGSLGEQMSHSYLGEAGSTAGSIAGSVGSDIKGLFGSKEQAKPEGAAPPKIEPSGCDHFYAGSALAAR